MIFPGVDQLYRLIQRELPEDVYADGSPEQFYTTADSYSTGKQFADAYENLQRIYLNKFPQSAVESITDWEITLFGSPQPQVSVAASQDRLVQKLREQRGINESKILLIVAQIIGSSRVVEIAPWSDERYSWVLDESALDISTRLFVANGSEAGVLDPDLNEKYQATPPPGVSSEDWQLIRQAAYTYSVLIYGYTLTDTERMLLDAALTRAEPARSAHVIEDGLSLDDKINGSL